MRQRVSFEQPRVLGGDVEEHLAAGVGGDCFAQLGAELVEVLVGRDDRQAVPASLGEHVAGADRLVEEVLELVHDQCAVRSLPAATGAGAQGLPEPGDEQGAEQACALLTDRALGQAHEQNPTAEHGLEVDV